MTFWDSFIVDEPGPKYLAICDAIAAAIGRGDLRPLVDMFGHVGTNGIQFVAETRDADRFADTIELIGREHFCIGCFDGRALLGDHREIEREVTRKVDLARRRRILPSLHVTRVLPDVSWSAYQHYVRCLRSAILV